jgi:diguanylate cyclase (GGDEF)-like protein
VDLFKRLKNRPDSEHQQALLRVIITCLALGYAVAIYSRVQEISILHGVWFITGFFVIAFAILIMIFIHPEASPVRRSIGMTLDFTGVSILVHLLGQTGLVFIFIYLWIIVGNGLRYGKRSLFESLFLGVFFYLLMVANTPYWRNDTYLVLGYLFCMILVPLYFYSMLKKLNTSNAELAKLADKLQIAAMHDSLTGLPNRALFQESLEHALSMAQRRQERLAVLFIDLDGFKQVNDTHGHQSGDAVLTTVASRLLGLVRKSDLVARFAGDEFMLLLNNANQKKVDLVARKVVSKINAPIVLADRTLAVTASIGIAVYPESGTTAAEILAKADTAMYQCKQQGKNRMKIAGDTESVQAETVIASDVLGNVGSCGANRCQEWSQRQ